MGYLYKYRQTIILLKNKYPENLFFCKKKIKKYNYLFEENDWIIKKTKKNLQRCSFEQYLKSPVGKGYSMTEAPFGMESLRNLRRPGGKDKAHEICGAKADGAEKALRKSVAAVNPFLVGGRTCQRFGHYV